MQPLSFLALQQQIVGGGRQGRSYRAPGGIQAEALVTLGRAGVLIIEKTITVRQATGKPTSSLQVRQGS